MVENQTVDPDKPRNVSYRLIANGGLRDTIAQSLRRTLFGLYRLSFSYTLSFTDKTVP